MSDCLRVKDFTVRVYGKQIDFVHKGAKNYGSVSKYLRQLIREEMYRQEG